MARPSHRVADSFVHSPCFSLHCLYSRPRKPVVSSLTSTTKGPRSPLSPTIPLSQRCAKLSKLSSNPGISHPNFHPPSQPPRRAFTASTLRNATTIQGAKARTRTGPLSFLSVVVFIGSGIGMLFYFRHEKARVERKRIADASKGMGRPKVGGKFELTDQDGKVFDSDVGMKGRFSIVYFGFTHCPDICPEELDKLSQVLDIVSPPATNSSSSPPASPPALLPIFITCDPARDTPSVLKHYLAEFHPSIMGLTGAWDQIKAVCKLYRVYFSTPEGVKPGMDYLVDHSIYFYLMDPEGDFVEAIGRQHTPQQAAKIISAHMSDWKRTGKTTLDRE